MTVVMYWSQQCNQRGQRIDTSQSQKVGLCSADVEAFFLGREFDGFPPAFFPCRVQGRKLKFLLSFGFIGSELIVSLFMSTLKFWWYFYQKLEARDIVCILK